MVILEKCVFFTLRCLGEIAGRRATTQSLSIHSSIIRQLSFAVDMSCVRQHIELPSSSAGSNHRWPFAQREEAREIDMIALATINYQWYLCQQINIEHLCYMECKPLDSTFEPTSTGASWRMIRRCQKWNCCSSASRDSVKVIFPRLPIQADRPVTDTWKIFSRNCTHMLVIHLAERIYLCHVFLRRRWTIAINQGRYRSVPLAIADTHRSRGSIRW